MHTSDLARLVAAGLCLLLGACAAQARPPAAAPPIGGFAAVLIAGDGSLQVFDNAVTAVRAQLPAHGATAGEIQRLSGSRRLAGRHGIRSATLDHVLSAIATMRPSRGQGCVVFATSHGGKNEGLWLSASEDFLTPRALDQALLAGCGDAPTAVVISACFSGIFAQPPMTRANRIVLTAARPDRTSFGCHAGRTYTVYDQCLLAAFARSGSWKAAYASIRTCVAAEEEREQVTPSEPQGWFGAEVADLPLPTASPQLSGAGRDRP